MNFESVLVVTYGRSGSTLLQGLLNDIPGCLVRGENYNLCYGLFTAFRSLQRTRAEYGGEASWEASNPWFGASDLDEEKFIDDARTLIERQLVPASQRNAVSCYGFKEIRYVHVAPGELPEYLDFLRRLFPRAGFLFLTRDHAQVARSGWWSDWDGKNVDALLEKFEVILENYAKDSPSTFWLDYRDLTDVTDRLRDMHDFLGVPFDENRIRNVLSRPHSYQKVPEEQEVEVELLPDGGLLCEYGVETWNDPRPAMGTYSIGGVAVLSPDESGRGWKLYAAVRDTVLPVEWGIASPAVGKRHPGLSQAEMARYRVSGLNGTVTLRLEGPDGTSRDIARIRLPGGG